MVFLFSSILLFDTIFPREVAKYLFVFLAVAPLTFFTFSKMANQKEAEEDGRFTTIYCVKN